MTQLRSNEIERMLKAEVPSVHSVSASYPYKSFSAMIFDHHIEWQNPYSSWSVEVVVQTLGKDNNLPVYYVSFSETGERNKYDTPEQALSLIWHGLEDYRSVKGSYGLAGLVVEWLQIQADKLTGRVK